MALPEDLIAQAKHLAVWDKRKPRQANLRRAVSSAYYALFHLMTAACVRRFAPEEPAGLSPRIARAIIHSEIKEVCASISRGSPGSVLRDLLPGGFSDEVRAFAERFVTLQDARHRADYDLAAEYNRSDVLEQISQAEEAFALWRLVRADEEGVFLSAILFARRWSR